MLLIALLVYMSLRLTGPQCLQWNIGTTRFLYSVVASNHCL